MSTGTAHFVISVCPFRVSFGSMGTRYYEKIGIVRESLHWDLDMVHILPMRDTIFIDKHVPLNPNEEFKFVVLGVREEQAQRLMDNLIKQDVASTCGYDAEKEAVFFTAVKECVPILREGTGVEEMNINLEPYCYFIS
jgi:hypothetical protein